MIIDMEAKLIGKRLKLIRSIFNEGGKLSVEQFAFILQETGDKMRNYELGRATLPNRVLQTLHNRGFNVTFIVTGEGDVFNNSPAGNKFRKIIQSKEVDLTELWENIYSEINIDDMKKAEELKLKLAAEKEADRLAKEKAKEVAKAKIIKSKTKAKNDAKITKVAAGNMHKKETKPKKWF